MSGTWPASSGASCRWSITAGRSSTTAEAGAAPSGGTGYRKTEGIGFFTLNDAAGARDSQAPAAAKGEKDMKLNKVWALYYSATGHHGQGGGHYRGPSWRPSWACRWRRCVLPSPRSVKRNIPLRKMTWLSWVRPRMPDGCPIRYCRISGKSWRAAGALAVPVVLFGNRSYDNSLAGAVRGPGEEWVPYRGGGGVRGASCLHG